MYGNDLRSKEAQREVYKKELIKKCDAEWRNLKDLRMYEIFGDYLNGDGEGFFERLKEDNGDIKYCEGMEMMLVMEVLLDMMIYINDGN